MQFTRFSCPQGLGCLSGPVSLELAPHRLNLILGPNEAGKSTLALGLFFALYGASAKTRFGLKKKEDLMKRFRPWGSSPKQAVPLILELGSQQSGRFRIERDLESGTAQLMDLDRAQDVTQAWTTGKGGAGLGDNLLGLSDAVFLNTLCVSQNQIRAFEQAKDATTAVAEIQRAVEAGPADLTVHEALEKIEAALKSHGLSDNPHHKVKRKLAELDEAIAAIDQQLSALDQDMSRSEAALEENRRRANTMQQLQQAIQTAERHQIQAEWHTLQATLTQASAHQAQLAELTTWLSEHPIPAHWQLSEADTLQRMAIALEQSAQRIEALQARQAAHPLWPLAQATNDSFPSAEPPALPDQVKRLTLLLTEQVQLLQQQHQQERTLTQAGHSLTRYQTIQALWDQLSPEQRQWVLSQPATPVPDPLPSLSDQAKQLTARAHRANLLAGVLASLGSILLLAGWGLLKQPHLLWLATLLVGLGLVAFTLAVIQWRARQEGIRQLHEAAERFESIQSTQRDTETQRQTLAQSVGLPTDQGSWLVSECHWLRQLDPTPWQAWTLTQQRQSAVQADVEALSQALQQEPWIQQLAAHHFLTLPSTLDLATTQRLESLWQQWIALSHLQQELAVAEAHDQSEQATWKAQLCQALGVPDNPAETPESLWSQVQAAVAHHRTVQEQQQRYQQLLNSPGLLTAETLAATQDRLTQLQSQWTAMGGSQSDLEQPRPGLASEATYRDEVRRLSQHLMEARSRYEQSERETAQTRDAIYKQRPQLEAQRRQLTEARARHGAFQSALLLARTGLEQIGQQSHRGWAPILEARAQQLLEAFGLPYHRLRFSDSLAFSLEDKRSGQLITPEAVLTHLSAGARDLIFLAVRLAIAQYLGEQRSEGERLPLILDDPFVNCDDARFATAMAFLTRQATNGQLLLFSCHQERHQAWLEQLPTDLRAQVNLITLPSATSTGALPALAK